VQKGIAAFKMDGGVLRGVFARDFPNANRIRASFGSGKFS
jgi:hypothetical protein